MSSYWKGLTNGQTWWQFSRILYGGIYWLEKSDLCFLIKNIIKVRFRNKTLWSKEIRHQIISIKKRNNDWDLWRIQLQLVFPWILLTIKGLLVLSHFPSPGTFRNMLSKHLSYRDTCRHTLRQGTGPDNLESILMFYENQITENKFQRLDITLSELNINCSELSIDYKQPQR